MPVQSKVQPSSEVDSFANVRALAESFRRTLLAENKSPRTVATYTESIRAFVNVRTAHRWVPRLRRTKLHLSPAPEF